MRKQLAKWGHRGGPWVRVFLERSLRLVRVQWKASRGALIETDSRPDTPENRAELQAWAEGLWKRLSAGDSQPAPALTLRELWERYSVAEFPHLRPRSRTLYHENFRRWALMWGWDFIAERTTPEMADDFRQAHAALAPATIKASLNDVKRVYAWAEARELLQRNRLRFYRFKIAKEDRPIPPAEYRGDEFEKILRALNPAWSSQWRPYVALLLCGMQGARQNAVLHLTWADVENGVVTWRARWDKLGREWTQPLRQRSLDALAVARQWRERDGYEGAWVFYPGSSKNLSETYSKQSLWAALESAESRAGILKQKRRGAHGFRRMLAGDVAAVTGDAFLGLRAIGDTDPRMATRYIQTRDDRVLHAFSKLDSQPNRNDGQTNGADSEEPAPQPSIEGLPDE